jgi:hypothetical protein
MFLYFLLEFDLFDNILLHYYEIHLIKILIINILNQFFYLPVINENIAKCTKRTIAILENIDIIFFTSAIRILMVREINR